MAAGPRTCAGPSGTGAGSARKSVTTAVDEGRAGKRDVGGARFRRPGVCLRRASATALPSGPRRSAWMALPSRFLLLAAVLSIVVAATDAAAQTVTLSVPSGATLAEGGGSVDITVTATLSSVRTSETTITLSLGGTARATDYTVQSLPEITIAIGQTQSTATVVLTAVDDSF